MRLRSPVLALFLVVAAACGGGNKNKQDGGGSGSDSGVPIDAPGTQDIQCETLPPVSSGTCAVTAGGATTLLKGNVLTPTAIYHGGQVAIDTTGQITCAGCNCAAGGETVISCPDGTISPGLINTHDHITFTHDFPYTDSGERYEDRQQWRKGLDGHAKIPAPGGASAAQIRWGELRFLMGGATSIVGSGGQSGLLRNLDQAANEEGLGKNAVNFDTFPLGDSSGTRRTGDCNYGGTATTADSISANDSYEPHTSEGIDATAHNEFLCESATDFDTMTPGVSNDLVLSKTAMIHAVGLNSADYSLMASKGTSLIWSPRSNITLYGDTARVSIASRVGVNIALGTDWMPTGSMNLLRELKCADDFNQKRLNTFFSDQQLWSMVTNNAAAVTHMDDKIGLLAAGHVADITIFNGNGKSGFRSVLDAQPQDVVLVMRGGKAMYGDADLVGGLAQSCDTLDVCGTSKQVCLMNDIGQTLAQLTTAAGNVYPAFQCDVPMNEPTCTPSRPTAVAGSSTYDGTFPSGDKDGDGVPDADDNCPDVFNPIRPMDMGTQPDVDGDGLGDACDPCPLDKDSLQCTVPNPNDRDGDGVDNSADNCPDNANPGQEDADGDGKGDVCDACPNDKNEGAQGCPATIYDIKTPGKFTIGQALHVSNALVTGHGTNGFFVQVKETDTGYNGPDNSGLFVFTGNNAATLGNATVGARVDIDGTFDIFQGELELDNVATVTVDAVGPETAPAPTQATYAQIATGGTKATVWEGVLVTMSTPAVTVTAVDATFGEFTVTDGTNNLVVDDLLLPATNPAVGQTFNAMTGVLAFRQSASKLEPRSAADLVEGAPGLSTFAPGLSFIRALAAPGNTFPAGSELTVTLTGAAQADTDVTIATNDASVTVVGGKVTIPTGQTSAKVVLSGTTQKTDVTLTATLGTKSIDAHVRVLGPTETPATVTLAPSAVALKSNGTVTITATLDIPAGVTGTVVQLSQTPTSGNLPASVTIGANKISATFDYTDNTGNDTSITATLGGSTSTTTVTISNAAPHLVINEIDYDQPSTDTAEFIEIFNPTNADIDLTNVVLMLVDGNSKNVYTEIDLSSMASIPAHKYLVIGGPTVNVGADGVLFTPSGWKTQDNVQNGAPDGMALVDTTGPTILDAVSYEGSITAANLTGFATPQSLVEGTAMSVSDTKAGALCRIPDGQDSDNAAADWQFCATLTPGLANTP